jgi:UDP-N-acetylmuramoyl-tripeptide--D-alanyl-D-alanine ligase
MIESSLSQAAMAMNGELHGADAPFRGVSTDSRALEPGELFVALRGPHFDGARFVDMAAEKGAAGAVVQSRPAPRLPLITVDDTRLALGRLGADWRRRMPATVIGLTGSNGKTTLKEMIASILSSVAATLATRGNLNNDIGMPLMLLDLASEHRYAVLEMGANHAGEIAWLTSLAMPAIVAITNAAPAHLEGFGSIDGVARAKGEILQGSERPQTAVLNADDPYFTLWRSMAADLDVISFGLGENATVRASDITSDTSGSTFQLQLPAGSMHLRLPLPGAHNVTNACAAAAVALAAGVQAADIRHGLEAVQPVGGRLQVLRGRGGARLYDDSYNANPQSVIAAAEFVAARDGESWLVLGDMGELGADARALHRAVGEGAKRAGVDRLLATGPLSREAAAGFGTGADWFESAPELIEAARASMRADVNVLVKGSRAMRMERVVAALGDAPLARGEQ